MYQYSAKNLTSKYEDDNKGTVLTTSDCLFLSKVLHKNGIFKLAKEWLDVTKQKAKFDKCFSNVEELNDLRDHSNTCAQNTHLAMIQYFLFLCGVFSC